MACEYPESSRELKRPRGTELCASDAEIQCSTYTGIRLYRGDGEWVQPETLQILSKQKKESLIDHFSMATWLCGIIVIKHVGVPEHTHEDIKAAHTSMPLVNLLISSQLCDMFMVCGELSDKAVHHTHFMLKTNSRVDSIRRSLLNNQHKTGYVFEVCKLSTCRYWFGMFCYLLKNPLLVFCSNHSLADLAYTCIEQGDTIKYLKTPEKKLEGKDVVQTINKIITSYDCRTTDDIFKHGADELVKFLHLSSLQNIMTNCLQYTNARNKTWDPRSFKNAPESDPRVIHNILLRQGINSDEFDNFFWRWITRTNGKMNTLILQGPSNTGKSIFIRGLVLLTKAGSIINTSSPFFAEGICGSNMGIWEEPLLTAENAEMFKLISEGAPCQLPQKFKKPFNHEGCPILITTNHNICRFCISEEQTIMNRCTTFWFRNPITSTRGNCSDSCINTSRTERRSTPCYLNWSPSLGHTNRTESFDSSRISGKFRSIVSGCGRWWCGRNNFRQCSYCSRPKKQRSESGGSHSSSSTTISRDNRSSGEHQTRSSRNGIPDRNRKQTLRPIEFPRSPSPSIDNRDWGSGCGNDGRVGSGGIRTDARRLRTPDLECKEILSGGSTPESTSQSETGEQTSIAEQTCSCIVEPIPQDWQAYLCFLANKYE